MTLKQAMTRFFDSMLESFPADSSGAVGWSSEDTQLIRFQVLVNSLRLSHCTVLDVGCGKGDLFGYLQHHTKGVVYTGIDLHPRMVELAKKSFASGKFLEAELEHYADIHDYALVSGAFNLKVSDNMRYLDQMIHHLDRNTKRGFAFNLLSHYAPAELKYPMLCYYQPEAVFRLCKLRFDRVRLFHDYLNNDFTISIEK